MLVGLGALLALAGFVAYVVASHGGGAPAATDHGNTGHADTGRTAGTFADPPPPSLRAGTPAPAFTLASIVPGGAPVRLAAARGEPVVLDFFASWCPHCRADLAAFATLARREAGKIAVIGVDINDGSGSAARPLLRSAGAHYAVGVDPTGSLASRYELEALPTTYFLDRNGRVAGVAFGTQGVPALMTWVAKLTGAGPS
jgi:cytochrome c biogenesis protein CcmG/thiol:disulfide interchange protein DsbE